MSEQAADWIVEENDGHVRTLTFCREQSLNAFNQDMYHRLAQRLRAADADEQAHVVVLAAKGKAFSAGQDLKEMGEMSGTEEGEGAGFEEVFAAFNDITVPVFAAVQGFGLGFGFTVLLHTDQNFLSEDARFKLPFLSLGVVPEAASSYLLPARVGMSRAAEWIYSGRWVSAEELHEAGLARMVVSPDEVLEQTLRAARELAQMPPKALAATKQLLWKPYRESVKQALRDEGEAFRERLASTEHHEAVEKFLNRKS